MATMTPAERAHRKMLKPAVDRLVAADATERQRAVRHLRAALLPDALRLLYVVLTGRVVNTRNPDHARNAVRALVGLGASGVMRACGLTLHGPSEAVWAAAAEALCDPDEPLTPEEYVELIFSLQVTKSAAKRPSVADGCDALLTALTPPEYAAAARAAGDESHRIS